MMQSFPHQSTLKTIMSASFNQSLIGYSALMSSQSGASPRSAARARLRTTSNVKSPGEPTNSKITQSTKQSPMTEEL